MAKGQVSTSAIPGINSFNTEVAYKDIKYPFHVERLGNDIYRFSVGDSVIDATVTETAEGALLATFGGETHRIFGMDEPLGLRLVLDGVTILMYVPPAVEINAPSRPVGFSTWTYLSVSS